MNDGYLRRVRFCDGVMWWPVRVIKEESEGN